MKCTDCVHCKTLITDTDEKYPVCVSEIVECWSDYVYSIDVEKNAVNCEAFSRKE